MMQNADAVCDSPNQELRQRNNHKRLCIAPSWRRLFDHHDISSFDALISYMASKSYEKSGLPGWRKRDMLSLTDANGTEHVFYRKLYLNPPMREQWRRILAGVIVDGQAGLEVRAIARLQESRINVPEVAAYGVEQCCGLERRSFHLLTEMRGESLESWANSQLHRAERRLIISLAEFIARFHNTGCIHRDLYLCHIFVKFDRDEPSFGLIDLARVIHPRWIRRRWIVKDLASLNYSTPAACATRTDRLRFLKAYLQHHSNDGLGDWKSLARAIANKTSRIDRHDQKRQARIQ
jgi:hypothetical protein